MFKDQAALFGTDNSQTAMWLGFDKLAMKDGMNWQQELEKERAKQEQVIKDTQTDNANLAAAKQSMENLQKTMEQMATQSGLVAKMLPKLAGGLEDLTIELFKKLGLEVPPLLSASKDLRNAQTAADNISQERTRLEKKAMELGAFKEEDLTRGADFAWKNRQDALRRFGTSAKAEVAAYEKLAEARKKYEEVVAKQTEITTTSAGNGGGGSAPTQSSSQGSTGTSGSPPAAAAQPAAPKDKPPSSPPAMPSVENTSSGNTSTGNNARSSSGSGVTYTPDANGSDPKVTGTQPGVSNTPLPSGNRRRQISAEEYKEIAAANADKWDRVLDIYQQNADAEKKRVMSLAN
jgi:hypothetical protein